MDFPDANTFEGVEKNLSKSNPRDLVISSVGQIRVEAAQNTQKVFGDEVESGMEVCHEALSSGIN